MAVPSLDYPAKRHEERSNHLLHDDVASIYNSLHDIEADPLSKYSSGFLELDSASTCYLEIVDFLMKKSQMKLVEFGRSTDNRKNFLTYEH